MLPIQVPLRLIAGPKCTISLEVSSDLCIREVFLCQIPAWGLLRGVRSDDVVDLETLDLVTLYCLETCTCSGFRGDPSEQLVDGCSLPVSLVLFLHFGAGGYFVYPKTGNVHIGEPTRHSFGRELGGRFGDCIRVGWIGRVVFIDREVGELERLVRYCFVSPGETVLS